ncbi:hypothetical protein K501DRAFT_278638 [Backusella circina FSU 941]|nr:hypothetical protein K501DRAFT_278638 [Backusella circina FSU 941]
MTFSLDLERTLKKEKTKCEIAKEICPTRKNTSCKVQKPYHVRVLGVRQLLTLKKKPAFPHDQLHVALVRVKSLSSVKVLTANYSANMNSIGLSDSCMHNKKDMNRKTVEEKPQCRIIISYNDNTTHIGSNFAESGSSSGENQQDQ